MTLRCDRCQQPILAHHGWSAWRPAHAGQPTPAIYLLHARCKRRWLRLHDGQWALMHLPNVEYVENGQAVEVQG